jgi:hypothetical protein
LGNQANWGTAVAGSIYLAGIDAVSFPNSLVTERQQLLRGIDGPGKNIVAPRFEARGITLTGQAIYEQMMYYLDGLAVDAVPVGVGPYVYSYPGPTTTAAVPRYQTLIAGYADGIYRLNAAVIEGLSLSWQWGEIAQMTSTWMGYAVEDGALAALTEPTDALTTEATGCHVLAYVDAWGGVLGATVLNTMLSGSIDITPNREFKRFTGACYPAGVYDKNGWDVSGTLSFMQDATSAALMDAVILAPVRRLLRIELTNGGAGVAERSLIFDVRAELTIDELYTDNDDLVTADIGFRAIQDEADSDEYLDITLTNNTATAY